MEGRATSSQDLLLQGQITRQQSAPSPSMHVKTIQKKTEELGRGPNVSFLLANLEYRALLGPLTASLLLSHVKLDQFILSGLHTVREVETVCTSPKQDCAAHNPHWITHGKPSPEWGQVTCEKVENCSL